MNFDYSIVIPLYNHEKYIEQALLSCVEQTVPPQKIIVIDDGSTDNSFAIARKIASHHPQIHVTTRANRGAHATINEGLFQVTTPFVAILNSDDVFVKNRFEVLRQFLINSPSTDLIFSGISFFDSTSKEISKVPWYENGIKFYKRNSSLPLALINANFAMTTSNFLFRTSLVQQLGGFADYRYAHDLDFLLRLLANDKKIEFLEQKLIYYRMHPQNTIRESVFKVHQEVSKIQKDFIYTTKPSWSFILENFKISLKNRYFITFLQTMVRS